jgi:hypothetical protein
VVLFEPQLYFCAADLVRLMEYPEDLACGLQLDEFKPVQLKRRQHRRRRLHSDATAAATGQLQQQQAVAAAAPVGTASVALREGPMAAAVAAASQAVLQPEVPPEFELHSLRAAYDASREITGDMLSAHAPYFTSHGPSQELVTAGLPVPMYCCWGGLAKLQAGALAAGLRFRGGEEGECHPPHPMSLMCDDLWRTGRNKIIMVRVATAVLYAALLLRTVPTYPACAEAEVLQVNAAVDLQLSNSRTAGACCCCGKLTTAQQPLAHSCMCCLLPAFAQDPGVRTSSQLRTKSLFEHPRFPFFYYTHNWETTAWFDIHPLLPLQYWNSTTTAAHSNSSSSAGVSQVTDAAADADVASPAAASSWTAAVWVPGEQQMCCEGQQWSGMSRPNHPTDCRRVKGVTGKNFTQLFLQRCAAGLTPRQGSGLGPDCG